MRCITIAFLSVLLLAACVRTVAHADEPSWTDAERAERSVAVFTGAVQSVERLGELNTREDLYRAVVAVERAEKNIGLVGDGRIALYFEYPKNGLVGARCPSYVELTEGQRATFFVRLRKIGLEVRAFLDMGSDVRGVSGEKG